MEARLDYAAVAPGAMKAMKGLQAYINTTDLEHSLLELVKLLPRQDNMVSNRFTQRSIARHVLIQQPVRVQAVGMARQQFRPQFIGKVIQGGHPGFKGLLGAAWQR